MLRRMVQATEWQIPVFVTDFDVAAALDHVSHREIIKATLAMGAPPVLTASRVREYKKSETLDDIVTPGIRRAWSVPQGDPCAADLFGAALDTPAANFCDMCQHTKMDCFWETGILVSCCSRTIAGSSRCRQESSVVLDGTRQPGCKHHRCVGHTDHSTHTRGRVQSTGSVDHFRRSFHTRTG